MLSTFALTSAKLMNHSKPAASFLLQRKRDCGAATASTSGICEECDARRLQTKLTVGEPDDVYEQEADRIAQTIFQSPRPAANAKAPAISPIVQRSGEQGTHSGRSAPPSVDTVLSSSGQPLDIATRSFFEPRFRHDFSRVRVHTGAAPAESARSIGARAYTAGRSIIFGSGEYAPATEGGRRLLAHELTHVVQQGNAQVPLVQGLPLTASHPGDRTEREADRVAGVVARGGAAPPIVERPAATLARATFDVDAIAKDTDDLGNQSVPIVQMSMLFFKVNGHAAGNLTMAADYPTSFIPPADKSKPVPVGKLPKADPMPPLSNIPVEAHFFPSPWPTPQRAAVFGGFHGDEQPGWQATDALVNELTQTGGTVGLAFHTIIVPRVNAAAIADELAGVKLWRNRCNRQLVDLNRNFPVTGKTPKDTDCPNTAGAPTQPEVQGAMDIITKFKPDRIVSTHAISNPKSAGIFADPNRNPEAIALARGMASTVVNKVDRPANKLGPGVNEFNPVYPGDKPGVVSGGTSLGAWAPTAIRGRTTPVITMETPGFGPLGTGSGSTARTMEGALRPLRAFLGDPAQLATAADRDILADIDAYTVAARLAFLTGTFPKAEAIFDRIRLRVETAVAKLNAVGPPQPISIVSWLRLFSEQVPNASPQAQIDFDKFFLTGDKVGGWDTLPDQFFKNGKPSDGVDRTKWLATSSKERLAIILKFSSLPGASRHHWGTEVDLNSTDGADWQQAAAGRKGRFFELGQWLPAHAPVVGLLQAYTSGRSGGYNEEPWHYSYAPISLGLRQRYNQQVKLTTDVVDKIVAEFDKRARAVKKTVPTDFAAALKAINISDLVNNIGPGL